ncbi:hypothetical protein SAMN04488530_10460 [Asaccharospora irregularis DSM 2635]|uniref:Uncharacterized protein n=2 Tax=Asaccharospora TaxID=1505660 RepID=A0A1M5LA49_9FIRM|nr:hypothetical protein SAMN04488530_10460 [Asaccharospora irregularis DSM 2635]
MMSKKLKSIVIITSTLVFTMVGSCFGYNSSFSRTFNNGNYINGRTMGNITA